jgi:hypothetical protein
MTIRAKSLDSGLRRNDGGANWLNHYVYQETPFDLEALS